MNILLSFYSYGVFTVFKIYLLPSQITVSDHYRPASETPFEWRFAGGLIEARFYMLIRQLLPR